MDKENTTTAKDEATKTEQPTQNTETTAVYQCQRCGRLMPADRALCGVCLFYQINAQINGNIYFY